MLNAELVAPVTPVAVAERVYPFPALSMEALLKVATPLTGDTLATVPDRVPLLGFVPIASEIWFVAEVTRLLRASRISTWIAGAIDAPDTALVGCTAKFRFAAAPGFTTTVGSWVISVPFTVAVTVFDSATVDERVPVATPLTVVPAGCVTVFPVPVLARTTVAPEIRFPFASFAVTVMVLALVPVDAVIGDVAATVDCAAETAPGLTTTVGC